MKVFSACLFAAIAAFAVLSAPAWAQSKGASEANEAAYEKFSRGDYAGAVAAYEQLLKNYPTDAIVPTATIQLAFAQFFSGDFEKAQATLAKAMSGPALPADVAQVAANFLPQILSAKAASLPLDDPKRKAAFEEAIQKFSDFIAKYPQSPELENSIYGRALAYFQIQNYDKAIEDLQSNIQKFPKSESISSSKQLLALALATKGSMELTKDSGDKNKGMALLKQGEDLLRQIITEKKSLTLINDANFQLGEILLSQAAFSPENERPALYQQALEAYRSVLPKEEVIELQSEKIKSFPALKAAALRANNAALKKQLDKDNERELRKLEEIKAKPDQIATAILKMGEIFFNAQKYNETRVLVTHAKPHLTTKDEKMRAQYYTTMSYIVQNAIDKAVENYQQFIAAYKGNPLAENLPFAMGNMYLSAGNPSEAIRYFDESISQYPKGRFTGLSVVSKAQAQVLLKNFDEALKTFQTYLAQNPSPEVAVVAQYGLAGIYKDTKRWDDAITAYKTVKEKFPKSPQAMESDYWIAICTQEKGDHAAAIPLLEAFIKANPTSPLTPLAIYALGAGQIALNKKEEGIATLAMLAEKYPDSQPAPYTYFMRAQLRAADQKVDDVNKLMRQFIEKYPKDDKIFFAYDSIAQNAVNSGKPAEAIASYTEFVQRYPENPKAVEALYKTAELQRGTAERLATNYSSLNTTDQAKWRDAVQLAVSTVEEMLAKYPNSPDLAQGLQSLLISQRMLLRAGLKDDAAVETYFQELSNKTSDASAKSKILFTLASFLSEKDKARALAKMKEAFNPDVIYSPKDLDIYGLALIDEGNYDEATTVFQKLATKDYPIPPGLQPAQATAIVQEAQATALFGLARIAQEKKQTAEAGKLFQQLKTLYPWSPKVLEADYGIAEALHAEGKQNEALQLLPAIIRAPNATAELRANSMLLGGMIMVDKRNAATDPKEKDKFRDAAIDYFIKIAQFYGGVPTAAARGLWEGAQLLEEQSNASSDAKFKAQQLDRAKAAYKQLVNDFPNSEFTPKAKARLNALGVS